MTSAGHSPGFAPTESGKGNGKLLVSGLQNHNELGQETSGASCFLLTVKRSFRMSPGTIAVAPDRAKGNEGGPPMVLFEHYDACNGCSHSSDDCNAVCRV